MSQFQDSRNQTPSKTAQAATTIPNVGSAGPATGTDVSQKEQRVWMMTRVRPQSGHAVRVRR